jgi:hypothetical protein
MDVKAIGIIDFNDGIAVADLFYDRVSKYDQLLIARFNLLFFICELNNI